MMEKQVPKVIEVEMMATILKVKFDNNKVKYIKSRLNTEMADAYVPKKGKWVNTLLTQQNSWLGTDVKIENKGLSVVLNEGDSYTSEELWDNGKDSVDQL